MTTQFLLPRCSSVWLTLLFWTRCMWLVRVQAALWLEVGGWRWALWQGRHARSCFAAHTRFVTLVCVITFEFYPFVLTSDLFFFFFNTLPCMLPTHVAEYLLPPAWWLLRSAGHFLFLQVRETNSHPHASAQSSFFPPPHSSTAACQVNEWLDDPFDSPSMVCSFYQCALFFCFSIQMRFSLYLYGNFNGSLQVARVEEGTDTVLTVWERNVTGTDDWEELSLQLTGLQHGYRKKEF